MDKTFENQTGARRRAAKKCFGNATSRGVARGQHGHRDHSRRRFVAEMSVACSRDSGRESANVVGEIAEDTSAYVKFVKEHPRGPNPGRLSARRCQLLNGTLRIVKGVGRRDKGHAAGVASRRRPLEPASADVDEKQCRPLLAPHAPARTVGVAEEKGRREAPWCSRKAA
jgi:hypothetical protein